MESIIRDMLYGEDSELVELYIEKLIWDDMLEMAALEYHQRDVEFGFSDFCENLQSE